MEIEDHSVSKHPAVHGAGGEVDPDPQGSNGTGRHDSVVDSNHRLVYSVPEAARLLDISRAFAYELVAHGDLPVLRLGRRLLVPKVALMALVEAGDGCTE